METDNHRSFRPNKIESNRSQLWESRRSQKKNARKGSVATLRPAVACIFDIGGTILDGVVRLAGFVKSVGAKSPPTDRSRPSGCLIWATLCVCVGTPIRPSHTWTLRRYFRGPRNCLKSWASRRGSKHLRHLLPFMVV